MSLLIKGIGGNRQLAHGFTSGVEGAIIGGGVILNKKPNGSLNAGVTTGVVAVGVVTTPNFS